MLEIVWRKVFKPNSKAGNAHFLVSFFLYFFFFFENLVQGRSLEYGFGAKSGQILLNRVRSRAFPPSAEKLL